MSKELLFWILYLFGLIFGLWYNYTPNQPYPYRAGAWVFLVFILIGLLGWQVFGAAIKP